MTGFRFSGVACGIKSQGSDLSLIVADENCCAGGVYTQNLFRAACIDWNLRITPSSRIRAVVTNSGNANACTGPDGLVDCETTAAACATMMGCQADQVLVLSTGVIGHRLPIERIYSGIDAAFRTSGRSAQHFFDAADAILTTDRGRKILSRSIQIKNRRGTILGMAKGAGMIGPNLATMLCIVLTDFTLTAECCQQTLRTAVDESFNRISVDGHTSTNDAVLLLSSGQGDGLDDDQLGEFQRELTASCLELAKMIPADGEGATHLIEIRVSGTDNHQTADRIAKTIAASPLVKTAVAGNDPNWGRIVSAAGYSGVFFDITQTILSINGCLVFRHGTPVQVDRRSLQQSMAADRDVVIAMICGSGPGQSTCWTSDLTTEYVRVNSEYHT